MYYYYETCRSFILAGSDIQWINTGMRLKTDGYMTIRNTKLIFLSINCFEKVNQSTINGPLMLSIRCLCYFVMHIWQCNDVVLSKIVVISRSNKMEVNMMHFLCMMSYMIYLYFINCKRKIPFIHYDRPSVLLFFIHISI